MTGPHSALAASLLQQAVALHQQGSLQMAQALYRQVLELEPQQFDALHLSGVIARQQGDAPAAIALISQAIAIDGAQAQAHANLGAALQDAGRPQDALSSYDRAVQLKPGYAMAHSNRGNTLRKLGRLDEAVAAYEHALQLQPNYPEALCNRAIALQDLGRYDDALASAEQALSQRLNYADACFARGNALQSLRRLDDAVESYDRALHLKPGWAEVYCAQGTALQRLRHFDAALDSYARAVAIKPGYALAHYYRGNTLRAMGRKDEAVAAYQLAQEHGDDPQTIAYALASLGVGDTPAALPNEYVRSLFDQYADHFDQHLLEVLDYQTPAFLDQLLRASLAPEDLQNLNTLDLGCGTGLCAPYLRPLSRTLTGVDLSDKMLDKARTRGLYDSLVCGDLLPLLSQQTGDCDLAVAADVFVYIGDLAPVFAGVRQALRGGGHFCFSVEALEEDGGGDHQARDFALRPSNRYAHALGYLRRLAGEHGFDVVAAQPLLARQENGTQVAAHALLLRRS